MATSGMELTGNVLLYGEPEPLNPNTHGHLGITAKADAFEFLKNTHVVPVMVTEFGPAALSYPIIFAGEAKSPLAVMGLNAGQNLSVLPDNSFDPLMYLPSYIRRYPFVFAIDQDNDRMIVCLDKTAKIISDQPDVPFFKNGQPTDYTNQAIEFLKEYEEARATTDNFVKLITDLDLWEQRKQTFSPPQTAPGPQPKPIPVADFFAVSQAKLNKLPVNKLKELNDSGALAAIYAHLTSLIGWDRIVVKTAMRDQDKKKA